MMRTMVATGLLVAASLTAGFTPTVAATPPAMLVIGTN